MRDRGHRHAAWLSLCAAITGNALAKEPPADGFERAAAAIDDERGLLTPKGKLIIEPSLQYMHASSTEVAIEGFTVLPALAIGLFNVSEVQRETVSAALALRYGWTSRFETEIKVPYVSREETVKQRKFMEGSSTDILTDSEGSGVGDVELSFRYQLNGGNSRPVYIGSLRVKTTTGKGPFDIDREVLTDSEGTRIGEVFAEQPTGSGFLAFQPSITAIYPSDPAVLYGSINYLWNAPDDVGAPYGEVDPGDAFGFSFGLGFAVNNRTSFSLGYDHTVVSNSTIENDSGLEPQFDRIHVGSMQFGISQVLPSGNPLGVSLSLGVTDDAPDVQIAVKLPMAW